MKHKWYTGLVLVALALTLSPLCAQDIATRLDSIEQRLERIEDRLDSLLAALRGMEALIPTGVIRDSTNLYFGIIGPSGTILDWVAYYLSEQNLQGNQRRTDDFRPDPELPVGQRSELTDYRNSGYDRGHMAPAAAFKRSREAMSATFLLSNMSPQTPALNRNIWRILEEQVRQMVNENSEGWIFTGNVFMDEDSQSVTCDSFIGENRVAIPTHCFKAILLRDETGNFTMYAFLMPNVCENIPGDPVDYLIRVDKLEEITGCDFFPILDDAVEEQLESTLQTGWPQ
jgi:endonuclease G